VGEQGVGADGAALDDGSGGVIDREDYGPVRVLSGRHKGRIGYMDDFDYETERAVVYFGMPIWEHNVRLIPLERLEPVERFEYGGECYVR